MGCRAAEWYAQHELESQAVTHYERGAALDADNVLGVGADAAWKAMELSLGQTRLGAGRDALLGYLAKFAGTKPATDALVLVALNGALPPASLAPILRRHSQGLSDAWHLKVTAHIAGPWTDAGRALRGVARSVVGDHLDWHPAHKARWWLVVSVRQLSARMRCVPI